MGNDCFFGHLNQKNYLIHEFFKIKYHSNSYVWRGSPWQNTLDTKSPLVRLKAGMLREERAQSSQHWYWSSNIGQLDKKTTSEDIFKPSKIYKPTKSQPTWRVFDWLRWSRSQLCKRSMFSSWSCCSYQCNVQLPIGNSTKDAQSGFKGNVRIILGQSPRVNFGG